MPDGAQIVSEQGSVVTMQVTMPADDAGHIGRQCATCKRMFRMHARDFKALPDDQRLTCPYCCTENDHSAFITEQQQQRARGAAQEYGHQLVAGKLDDMFGNMVRSVNSSRGSIRMSYSSGSSRRTPRSLPPIVEEAPIRERTCDRCSNRYAVFGEHIACPVCGLFPPKVVAQDALDAQEVALAIFAQLPPKVLAEIREAGALERTAAGDLGSVVSILETFLKQNFLDRVTGGDTITANKGNLFQRLDDAAQLYRDHLGIELPGALGTAAWDQLCVLYGIRHLLTHTNGVVDAKHVARFPGHGFVVGQRVNVLPADTREAVRLARKLIDAVP
jgi:hypothetical protein